MTIHVWGGLGDDRLAGPCMSLCTFVFLLHVVLHGDVGGASLCSLLGLLFVASVWLGVTCLYRGT